MKIAIFIRVFAYAHPLLYGNKQKILFSCIKNEKFRTNSIDLRLPLFGIMLMDQPHNMIFRHSYKDFRQRNQETFYHKRKSDWKDTVCFLLYFLYL